MHQLKALIWKAYKVRLRSPLSTALDLGGPIVIILIYVGLKILIGSFAGLNLNEDAASANLFRNLAATSKPLNPRGDISSHLCTKILFYSTSNEKDPFGQLITEKCGIELIYSSSKNNLVNKLRSSLDERIAFKQDKIDLNRSNATIGCFTLPGSKEPSYQAGIVINEDRSFEIYMTDLAGSGVIHQPYSQGSTLNEFIFPHGDLNSGLYLLDICIKSALFGDQVRRQLTLTGNKINQQTNQAISNVSNPLSWRVKAFPQIAASYVIPILFMVFQLAANLCNAISTVVRISEDNENGLHHYIRASGVPAGIYWLSHMIVTIIHMTVQSLIIAVILAIPTSGSLFDPIHETNITMRWLLLITYSLSLNAHAMFIGSLFDRTSHALLVTCLLGVAYSMYPITFMLQWNPYEFMSLNYLIDFVLLNPVTNYTAFLLVLYAIYTQTNEPFNWSQLNMKIIGGGICEWSLGNLWILLIIQTILWFIITIMIDQFYYSSYNSFMGLLNFANELFCCNNFDPNSDNNGIENLKTKSAIDGSELASESKQNQKDPNRICCSLRNVAVTGPTIMMAHTKGDPLKLTTKQLNGLHDIGYKQASKTHQYFVNRNQRSSSAQYSSNSQQEEPIFLDEALAQHIVWHKTRISFENLTLNFRFNQVSFILGQTDVKELFFATLMGLRTLQSGNIILDGIKYTPTTLNLSRPHVGYLGEKDIFINEMTIFENLQFFGSLRDSSYTQYDSESSFVLSLLHLSSRKNNLPMILTNRSARKLALAAAAVGHTKLLLLVEPTLSLRWKPRCQVLNLLKKYKAIRSIIVDTSDVDEAATFGDRIILLKNGQADLDGTPAQLIKKLACGHWLVFEPTSINNGNKNKISNESIKALETLTNELFKQDKFERLDATKRSVYQELMKIDSIRKSDVDSIAIAESKLNNENLHKTTVILKVQQSQHSSQALCSILKMFAKHNIHGFRLSELTYESLEDVLVLRMSKAMYPDLPPDLLLSLQHRTQTNQADQEGGVQVSVRKCSSNFQIPKVAKSISGAKIVAIIKDRLTMKRELILTLISHLISFLCVGLALWALQVSLNESEYVSGMNFTKDKASPVVERYLKVESIEHSLIRKFYKHRIGLYIINENSAIDNSTNFYLNKWDGNKKLAGIVPPKLNQSDAIFVATLIQNSKDLVSSIVFFNPQTSETTILFEPHLPHAMIASIDIFVNYQLSLIKDKSSVTVWDNIKEINTSQHYFHQNWHQMARGHLNRRFFYGIGFALAEGVAIGMLVVAPVRHRSESRVTKVRTTYWLAMALFDLTMSLILVAGYTMLIICIETTVSVSLLICIILVLVLYKLASLPIAYLVSVVVEISLNGFLFIFFLYFIIGWIFSIHIKTFVEWTLISGGYGYTVASWIVILFPISFLIDSLTNINQINKINKLCSQVPAYTATSNIAEIEGAQSISVLDKILVKVRECLANGKSGISTDVLHQQQFGILWDIYLIILFGIVAWTFLLFSERVFGIIARRFTSTRTSADPMKTIIRSTEHTNSLFKWDREKDRLVSEYIKCMNETKYVRHMVSNCLYLRIWLKPMSDQSSIDKRIPLLIEPLTNLGQPKNEIQIELKTTLQLFIRIGNESNRYKVDRIQLIETYSKFLKEHTDTVAKFAVVDWTRETLYKILLHGHYNTKSTSAVT